MKKLILTAFAALALASFGAEIKSNTEGDANNSYYDCFRYGQYVKSGGTTVLLWMDGNPPTAENDYLIPGGLVNTPNYSNGGDKINSPSNFVFQGKSLTLKGGSLGLYTFEPSSVEFLESRGGVELGQSSCFRSRNTGTTAAVVKGLVRVTSTSSKTASIKSTTEKTNMGNVRFDAKLKGEATAYISVDTYGKTANPGNVRLALHGDCSEYFGTIRVNGVTNRLRIASAGFPGTVKLVGPCRFESVGTSVSVTTLTESDTKGDDISIAPTSTLTVANLTLKDKSTIYYEFAKDSAGAGLVGSLAITESLTIDPAAKVAIDVSALKAGPDILVPSSYVLIKIPTAKGTLSADNFELAMPAVAASAVIGSSTVKGTGLLPNWTHEVTTVDDPVLGECSALVVRQIPVVLRIKGKAESDNPNDATAWSDNQAVHADADYLVPYESSQFAPWGDKTANFFKGPAGLAFTSAYSTFGGRSLTTECWIDLNAETVRIDDLTMLGGQNYDGAASHLYGKKSTTTFTGNIIRVYTSGTTSWGSASVIFRAAEGCTLCVDAPVVGPGNLTIEYPHQDNAKNSKTKGSVVQMLGDNSQFTGRLRISDMLAHKSYTEDKVSREPNVTLRVSDEKQLGGKMASFAYNGLYISRWGCLENVGDLTLSSDESNRGLYVEGYGHIRTPEGTTLTMNKRLTMAGELYKSGKGVLLLGSETAPKFTSKQSAWSDTLEGTNVVTVADGAFGATTRAASAGLAVTFTESGALLVDAGAEGDQATYGYDATAEGSSVTGIGGKIPLMVKSSGVSERLTLAALTLPSTAAEPSFALVSKPYQGASIVDVSSSDNGDGTTTYSVTVDRTGAIIFLR